LDRSTGRPSYAGTAVPERSLGETLSLPIMNETHDEPTEVPPVVTVPVASERPARKDAAETLAAVARPWDRLINKETPPTWSLWVGAAGGCGCLIPLGILFSIMGGEIGSNNLPLQRQVVDRTATLRARDAEAGTAKSVLCPNAKILARSRLWGQKTKFSWEVPLTGRQKCPRSGATSFRSCKKTLPREV
jgi:hypothetical protein